MKRLTVILAVFGLALSVLAGTALARGNGWGEIPPHGHVLLLGVEIGPEGAAWDRCVEVAAGKALRGPAHHNSIHTGNAGGSPFVPGALFRAGHGVVPLNPFVPFPWFGCEDIPNPLPFN